MCGVGTTTVPWRDGWALVAAWKLAGSPAPSGAGFRVVWLPIVDEVRTFFESLSEEDVARILGLATPISLRQGEVLFGLGDEATELYLVERGVVNLTLPLRVGGTAQDAMVEERLVLHSSHRCNFIFHSLGYLLCFETSP